MGSTVDMAVRQPALFSQSKIMKPLQPTRHRASTQVSATPGVAGLTPCAESKGFAKLQKKEIKALEKRKALYEKGSAPALAIEATIARTNARFDTYGKAGLLCGTDGLPHLISEPGLALKYGHGSDTLIPTIGFLLFAGWIGESGRAYLGEIDKDTNKEIILDVPLALKCMGKACAWPATVVSELRKGTLTASEDVITRSPRL